MTRYVLAATSCTLMLVLSPRFTLTASQEGSRTNCAVLKEFEAQDRCWRMQIKNSPAMSKADEKMAVETVETRFLPVFTGNDNTERAPECACPCFTSSLRRRLAKIESFVAVMSMYILFFVSTEMYLMAVITTIEKRFGFNSYQSGMLFSAKEITYFCTVTFVSHFAKKSHRPRLIGVMGYIGVLAGYVSALPHFFFGGGSVSSLTITAAQRSDPMLCRTGDDMTTSNRTTDHCDDSSDSFHVGAYSVFIMSAILLGLSQSCQGALSATYVDDSVTKDKVALYLGIISAMRPFGPMLGFLLGGLFTSFPEDFTDPGYDNSDPRWVGAWWLGYIVCPTIFLIPASLLIFFPKSLKRPKSAPEAETSKMAPIVVDMQKEKREGIMGFLWSFRRLLENPVYMVFLIAACLGAFVISGMFPFLPKYLETQFSMTAATANLLLGSVATMMAGCGVFIGGLILSRLRWSAHHSALYVFIINFLFACVVIVLMFIGCEQPSIVGLNTWSQNLSSESASCSVPCREEFYPICGSDNQTYLSPCLAGCTSMANGTYQGCMQIMDAVQSARPSMCPSGCIGHIIYIVLLSFGALLFMTGGIPGYIVIMRSVDDTDKSLALGLLGTAISLASFVPGPIAFGAIVDSSCLLWRSSCGADGSCQLYDNASFRYRLHATTAMLIAASDVLCAVVTTLLWRRHWKEVKDVKKPSGGGDIVLNIGASPPQEKPPILSSC